MYIFVDESGSFVPPRSGHANAWNSIAAFVLREGHRSRMSAALATLKRETSWPASRELKLRDIGEPTYFRFLARLARLDGVLFAVLTDMATNGINATQRHQRNQAANIVKHAEKMLYETGRAALHQLSDQVNGLSAQLYVQLQCQVELVDLIVRSASLYFAQRHPRTLRHFRWRIDQKNATRTKYERSFFALTPALLQSRSLADPWVMLEGADYSGFDRFDFPAGEEPTYLRDAYGIDTGPEPLMNLGKLFRESFEFVDSQQSPGVQVADLLAAGLRRALRGGFDDNARASRLLGAMMVQAERRRPPVRLLTLSSERVLTGDARSLVAAMTRHARPMLA